MKITPNLGLRKPEQDDFYNVDDFNYNADVLDQKVGDMEEKIAEGSVISDPTSNKKYRWGIENGLLYVEEVV